MAETKHITSVKTYKVRDGDTLKSLADAAGITWQELAKYNWKTADPDKINACLRIHVGCRKKTSDGRNYIFTSKDDPGIIYIPQHAPEKTYGLNIQHIIQVIFPDIKPHVKAECYVGFRPKPDWKGDDYGFDWMRQGDFDLKSAPNIGKNSYQDIVGKHYVPSGAGWFSRTVFGKPAEIVQPDGNSFEGSFKKDSSLYADLQSLYEKKELTFSDGSKALNYTAFMTIYMKEGDPHKKVEIQAQSIIKKKPDQLELRFDNKVLSIKPTSLSQLDPTGSGSPHKEKITIECKSTFDKDETVSVVALSADTDGTPVEEVVGRLKICANSKSNRKIRRVVLIPVKTPAISDASQKTGNVTDSKNFLVQSLRQALIDPVFDKDTDGLTLDLTGESDFGTYVKGDAIIGYKEGDTSFVKLEAYCFDKYRKLLKKKDPSLEHKYDGLNYLKAFYFGEDIIKLKSNGKKLGLNGYSTADHEFVVMSGSAIESTAAHEFLHALHLPHSFNGISSDAHFTYKGTFTENIMDYTHLREEDDYDHARMNLWYWQWQVANGSATPEP